MRKALLAIAALTGTALSANAAMLKVSDQTFANVGIKMQIYGQFIEDATGYEDANGNWHAKNTVDFTIQNARIYFSGQLNKIVQFGANLDFTVTGGKTSHEGTGTTKVRDAFINFHFMDELNIMAGYYRLPFSRETLTDRYERIFMPQDGWVGDLYKDQLVDTLYIPLKGVNDKVTSLFITASNVLGGPSLGNALTSAGLTDEADFSRDAGVTLWGNVLNGMIKYYVGIYDGFGDHNVAEVVNGEGKDNFGYAIRLEFTPTMLGFKADKGYLHKETYLGKKNNLTIGIGYAASKLDLAHLNAAVDANNNGVVDANEQQIVDKYAAKSYTFKSWVIDVNYEQKFGVFVPKFEAGYINSDMDNLPVATDVDEQTGLVNVNNADVAKLDKIKTWYVKAGVLYDQQLWLGKVGFYVSYQKSKLEFNDFIPNQLYLTDNNGNRVSELKPSVWSVAIPYYLADQNAKIVFQWNHYNYDKKEFAPRNNQDKTANDWTLAFQVQF